MMKNLTTNHQPEESIAALILAGGQSSRMGRDKALLLKQDRTLLSHVCNVAQELINCVYAIAPWSEKYRDSLPSSVTLLSETIIIPGSGSNCPLIGFFQGLQQIEADYDWILLLACDLPNLEPSAIAEWRSYLAQVKSSEIALLPRGLKGYEPLCGFYRSSCLPLLANYIDSGGRSFQAWLKQHPVAELPISDRSVLFNCNTPEDWNLVVKNH